MKLTVLGYLGGFPDHGDGTSSYLIESAGFKLLVDCGSGALLSLEQVVDPLSLDAVLLTHYHNDHIADVGVLQYYWQLHPERPNKDVLPIYGHTLDQEHFNSLDWPNSTQKVAYDPSGVLDLGPFSITFSKTEHPVPAFATRIVEKATGKVLVFTADTRYFEDITGFCQDADLLMTDTNFFADKQGQKWHMTSAESGKLARDAKVKSLLMTHLPAKGDMNQLIYEAQRELPENVPVEVASTHLEIEI
ncbi:MBL fold metallo-hydrolase [Lentilactobacillus sp. Marseille-Q4993]|uniref:MBL fold metallo-hydrolase n=1 Tax=Lentilactobacillus sp. Marseille-Q4993 TaxID=3039492 RepID=UPI0024BD54A7|nr:MBL fold metallo-hydrolase [Lentilactobacillus sp. Marseille-Q4993]